MENDLTLMFWLGTAMTLCLFSLVLVLIYIYQKGMIRQLELQQNVRIQIEHHQMRALSQEIHDGICSDLAAVLKYMEHLDNKKDKNKEEYLITSLKEAVKSSYQNALNLCYNLYPSDIEEYRIVDIIKQYVGRIQKVGLIQIDFTTNKQTFVLSNTQKIELYRSLQEIVQNILKHSKATKVTIGAYWNINHLFLKIKDDGIAYDFMGLSKEEKGIGLVNILTRTKHIKAMFTHKSKHGNNDISIKIDRL
ncbi:sensor histidine kinase [Myroides sp. C8-3]|uniref:sensor histidine kinase n=1 Tax=Myroides sp. C8-3 TaxID=3400533 RepID=UPI003D2F7A84